MRKPFTHKERGLALIEVLLGLVVITIAIAGLERVLSERNQTRIQASEAREVRALVDHILARAKVSPAIVSMSEGDVSPWKASGTLKSEGLLAPVFGDTLDLAGAPRSYGAHIRRGRGDRISVALAVEVPGGAAGLSDSEKRQFERLSGLPVSVVEEDDDGQALIEIGAERVGVPISASVYNSLYIAFATSGLSAPEVVGNNNVVNFNVGPAPDRIDGSFAIPGADKAGFMHPLGTPLTYDIADKIRKGWRLRLIADAPEVSGVELPHCPDGQKRVAMLAPNLDFTFSDGTHKQTLKPLAFESGKTMDLYHPKPLFPGKYTNLADYEGEVTKNATIEFDRSDAGSGGVRIIPDEMAKTRLPLMRLAAGSKLSAEQESHMGALARALRTEIEEPGEYGSNRREWSQMFSSNYALGVAPARMNPQTNRFTHATFTDIVSDTAYDRDNYPHTSFTFSRFFHHLSSSAFDDALESAGARAIHHLRTATLERWGELPSPKTVSYDGERPTYAIRQSKLRALLEQYNISPPQGSDFQNQTGGRLRYERAPLPATAMRAFERDVGAEAFDGTTGVAAYEAALGPAERAYKRELVNIVPNLIEEVARQRVRMGDFDVPSSVTSQQVRAARERVNYEAIISYAGNRYASEESPGYRKFIRNLERAYKLSLFKDVPNLFETVLGTETARIAELVRAGDYDVPPSVSQAQINQAKENSGYDTSLAAAKATLEAVNPDMAFYHDPAQNPYRARAGGFSPHEGGNIYGGVVPVRPMAGYNPLTDDTVNLPTPAKSFPIGFNFEKHELVMRCDLEGEGVEGTCSKLTAGEDPAGNHPAYADERYRNTYAGRGRNFTYGRAEIYYPTEYTDENGETKKSYQQLAFCHGEAP